MKYLLLKHYRTDKEPAVEGFVPFDQWTPSEFDVHVQFMRDYQAQLEASGEFVSSEGLSPEGSWVRSSDEGTPVVDGPFAETKDLIAGWMIIDVDSWDRAVEVAAGLSAAPGQGGRPIHEWLEVRPIMSEPPVITE